MYILKRTGVLLLALVMLLSGMPMTGFAAELETLHNQPALMTADGSCGQNLYWFLDSDGTMTISGSGAMLDYDSKPSPWFDYASEITKLVLEPGITYIGSYAFTGFDQLAGTLEIPEGVTGIGECAFDGCSSLTGKLVIPEGVTEIGEYAFYGCSGLTGLELPSTLISIDGSAFFRCTGMTGDLWLPESLTSLGITAFYSCGFDGVLFLPTNLSVIPYNAFEECSFTGDLILPDYLTTLESCAFYNCTGFDGELVIPDGVETLPDCAFSGMSGITSISFGTGLQEIYVSEDRDTAHWDALYGMSSVTEMTFHGQTPPVPTVEGISPFESMTELQNIYVPVEVMDLYQTAFSGYISDFVSISPIPVDYGPMAEGSCGDDLYWTLDYSGTLTIAGSGPMYAYTYGNAPWYSYSDQINMLILEEGITSISDSVFANCTYISDTLYIPEGVTSIGDDAFNACTGLTGLVLPSTLEQIGEFAFCGCSGMTGDLILPQSLTSLGKNAFRDSGFDGALVIPDSITQLPYAAFSGMRSITSITFGKNVAEIFVYTTSGISPFDALYGMTSVTEMTFKGTTPPVATTDGANPYKSLSALETVYVPAESLENYYSLVGLLSSSVTLATDPTQPQPVADLRATRIYSSTVTLAWDAYSGDVECYVICQDGTEVGTTTETSYTDTGMNPGATHTYTVRAKLSDGTLTPEASITVESVVPEVYSIETEHESGTIFRDTANISICVKDGEYVIELYYLDGEDRVLIGSGSGGRCTIFWDVTNLEDGAYTLVCVATDYDLFPAELSRTVTIDRSVPAKIPGVAALGDVTRIHLTWSIAAEADTERYHIYRRESSEVEFALLAEISGRNTLSYTDTAVNAEGTYYYYVVGVNAFGVEGEPSDTVSASLKPDTEAPRVTRVFPVNGAVLTGTVNPRLTAQDDVSVTKTQIDYSLDNGETWTILEADASLDTTTLPDGPIRIRGIAWDAAGNESTPVVSQCLIDNTGPEQVTQLSFESTSVTVTLRWQDVSDADIYFFRVERKNADGSYSRHTDVYSTLGVNIYGLTPGTAYTYRVVGYDTRGNRGIPSADITATTLPDDTAPVITALAPGAGYIGSSVTLSATAADEYTVKYLELQVSTDLRSWQSLCTQAYTTIATRQTLTHTLSTSAYPEGSLYLRAVAKDAAGNETGAGVNDPYVQYIIDRTAPAAPVVLGANGGSGCVEICWEQGTEADLGTYSVLRSSSEDGNYETIASGLAYLNYYDRTARPGDTWFYKVCVNDRAGNVSALSAPVSAAAEPDTQAPEVVSIYPAGGTIGSGYKTVSALIRDNLALDAVTVEYCVNGGSYRMLHSLSGLDVQNKTVSAEIGMDSLSHGDTVTVRVSVTDLSGNVGQPSEATYTVDKTAPAVSDGSAAYADESILITWTGSGEEDLAGYRVYRKAGISGGYKLIAQRQAAEKTDYSCFDYDLSAQRTVYYYKVEAVDTAGNVSSLVLSPVTVPDRTGPTPVLHCDSVQEVGVEYIFDASGSSDNGSIAAWHFDFGDGTTSERTKVIHTYAETGTYTVTLTLTDNEGNESILTKTVAVRERSMLGTARIRVVDETGSSVPGASVYFGLGSDTEVIKTTDSQGFAEFTAQVGTYAVGCIIPDNQWLPAKRDVIVTAGDTCEATLTMIHQPLVEGEFETRRMTFDEIVAAGINPYAPENQHIIRVNIHLTYGTAKVETSFTYNPTTGESNAKPVIVDTPDGRKREIVPTVIHGDPDPDPDPGSAPGSGGSGKEPAAIAYLDVPAGASFLKEFFDVKLHIINNAAEEFSMVDNVVQLNIPEGLTLVPGFDHEYFPRVTIPEIPGQSTKTLSWILRGDVKGNYYLSADYSGILEQFDVPIRTTFQATQPIEVWGLGAVRLIAEVNTIANYNAFYFNLSLENISDTDIYLPSLGVMGDTITSYLKLAGEEAKQVAGGVPNVRHLNTLLTNSSGYKRYIGTEVEVTKLSPGEKITNQYAAYNVMGYNNVMYLTDASYEIAQGYGVDFRLIQTDIDLFPMENATQKLSEIQKDMDKMRTYYYIKDNYNYFYVQESFDRDTNVGGLLAEGLYSGLKLVLNLDANYNTDETRKLTREVVAQMLIDESMQQVVDANVDTKFLTVTKAALGAIAGSLADAGDQDTADILGDFLSNSENVQGLSATLQQEGTSGFTQRLINQLSTMGLTAAGKAAINNLYTDNFIGSVIGDSVGQACGSIADIIEVVENFAGAWSDSREMTNNLIRICAAQEEALALVDMLLEHVEAGTAIYDELLAIREGMEDAIRDMHNQFQQKMGGAAGQAFGKEAVKVTLGFLDDAFGTNLGVVYTIAKLVFGGVNYIFDWGGQIEDTHVLRVCTYLSLALSEAVDRYGLDAANESQAMYTFRALKYLVKLRLLGEQAFVNICNGMSEKKQAEYLSWVNTELDASYPDLDAYCSDVMEKLLLARDDLFRTYHTQMQIPEAPVVTLNYTSCTTEEEFSPAYEYSFDGTNWQRCTGDVISFTPGNMTRYLSVRVAESAANLSGNIRRVTIPAKPYLLGDITIRHIDGVYAISGLTPGRYRYVFVDQAENAEPDQPLVADANGSAQLEISGDWTWLAIYAEAREDDFASRIRYVAVTHHYRSAVTAATCTEGGFTTYTCAACGDSYTDRHTAALGHDAVTDEALAATCLTPGKTAGSHCSRCETVLQKQEHIPALGHSFTNYVSDGNATTAADGTKTAKCDRCGERDTIADPGSRLLADVVMTGTTAHHTGIIVRWEAVENAKLYQVYRLRSGESAWTLLKNTGSTAYKDETAEVGVKYYYKVRARDGSKMSSLNIDSVSAIRPLANVVMTGAVAHVSGIIVSWNAVAGAQLYQVYRLRSGETSWNLLKNTGSTAYKDESAEVGVKYYYKVRARKGLLMSSLSIASVSATRPSPVTKLSDVVMDRAVGHKTGNIIYWNAVENAKLYQVYRLRSGETSWTLLKNTGSLAYKDETAEVGVKYYYKVVARNGDIKSSMNIASVSAIRPK